MNRFKKAKILSLILIFSLLVSIIPFQQSASASLNDPKDLETNGKLTPGETLNVAYSDYWGEFLGYWNVNISGAKNANGQSVAVRFKDGKLEGVKNFIPISELKDWTEALNGNYAYVQSKSNGYAKMLATSYPKFSNRIHIRDLAIITGAYVQDWDSTGKGSGQPIEIGPEPPPPNGPPDADFYKIRTYFNETKLSKRQ